MTFTYIFKRLFISIIVYILMPATPVYADSGDDKIIQAAAMTLIGVVGSICLLFGIKHIFLGDSLSGLLDKAKNGASELVDKAKDGASELVDKTDAAITTHRTELQGTVYDCVTRAEVKIDNAISTVNKINDNLDKMNPVSQAHALGEKTTAFFKNFFKKAADLHQSGTPGLDDDEGKIRLQTGLEKALQRFDETGNAEEALAQMSDGDLEMLASYTHVSPATSGSGAPAGHALPSVLEPHICGWDLYVQTVCEFSSIFFLGFIAILVFYFLIRVFVYIFRFFKVKVFIHV